MFNQTTQIRRGEIYYCDLGDGFGSEQGGMRPCVVLQNDIGNRHSPTTLIAPLTSRKAHKKLPTHIFVNKNNCRIRQDSVILLEQIRTVDRNRLRNYVTYLDDFKMCEVNNAVMVSFGLAEPERRTTE